MCQHPQVSHRVAAHVCFLLSPCAEGDHGEPVNRISTLTSKEGYAYSQSDVSLNSHELSLAQREAIDNVRYLRTSLHLQSLIDTETR